MLDLRRCQQASEYFAPLCGARPVGQALQRPAMALRVRHQQIDLSAVAENNKFVTVAVIEAGEDRTCLEQLRGGESGILQFTAVEVGIRAVIDRNVSFAAACEQNHPLATLGWGFLLPLVAKLGVGAADRLCGTGDVRGPKGMKAGACVSHRPLVPQSGAPNARRSPSHPGISQPAYATVNVDDVPLLGRARLDPI